VDRGGYSDRGKLYEDRVVEIPVRGLEPMKPATPVNQKPTNPGIDRSPFRELGSPDGGINWTPVDDRGSKPSGGKPGSGTPSGGIGIAPGERRGQPGKGPGGIPGGLPQGGKPGPGGIVPDRGKVPSNPDFGKPIAPDFGKPKGGQPGVGKPGPGGLAPGVGKPPSGPGTGGPLMPGGGKFPGNVPDIGKTGPGFKPGGVGKLPSPVKPDGAIMPGEVKRGWIPGAGKPDMIALPDKGQGLVAKAGGPMGVIGTTANHGFLPPLPPPPPLPGVSSGDYWRAVHHHWDHDAHHWFGGHHTWRHFMYGMAPAPWFWNYYPYYYTSPWVFGYYSPSVYVSWGWGVPYWYGRVYYPWWDWCDAPFVYYYYRYPSRFSFGMEVGPTVAYADAGAVDVVFERPLGVWVPGHYEGDPDTGEWVWIPGYYTY
jgi:hypothetical protein